MTFGVLFGESQVNMICLVANLWDMRIVCDGC